MSTRKTLTIAIVGTVAFFIIIGAVQAIRSSPDDEVSTTDRPLTAEHIPTPSPRPAFTPSPTAIPTPTCPTNEESEYINGVRSRMLSYNTQLTMFGEDLVAASDNPWLFLEDSWQFDRETQIIVMELMIERVAALQAPASASHISDQVDYMALEILEGLSMVRLGLQDIDGDLLEEGATQITDQTSNTVRLGYALNTFCE